MVDPAVKSGEPLPAALLRRRSTPDAQAMTESRPQ